jgi:ribosomal protein S18 acetylase RimI-like enzyme
MRRPRIFSSPSAKSSSQRPPARTARLSAGEDRGRPARRDDLKGVRLPASGLAYRLLDGTAAGEQENDLLALAGEVYGNAGDPAAARRARVRRRQPGFALAEARHGGFLVGYASGMPLRPSTSWWRELTTPLPPQVTTEHPGRTFAVTELLVRASWRRQGIGRDLHDLLLDERTEERATLTVAPDAGPAQRALRSWGWRKVARTRGDDPAAAVLDVLLLRLSLSR